MKLIPSLLMIAMSTTLMAQMRNPASKAGATRITAKTDLSGTAVSACGSITSPGDYYLSKDLSCPGTALLISGPGIHLNLNGHTITYGTSGGTMGAVFGIENDACWDTDHNARAVPCDNKNSGIGAEVYNGSIVQSNKAPAFSDAFFFGQNDNNNQIINVHNMTITVQQTGTRAFYSSFQSGQILFEYNTIYDNVKSINYPGQSDQGARSQFQGQAVHVDRSGTMRSPNHIDNNKIVGSPQGGIRDTSTGAMVYQNDISENSTYANDFCVDVPGINEQIYSNYCHPVNGRGIHVNGEGSQIYNNDIVVTEAAVIPEYHGCEVGGAYGIQIEQDIHAAGKVSITGNQATLNTGPCGGGVLRVTSWQSGATAKIAGNTWTVNKTAGADKYGGLLYYLDDANLSSVVFGGDVLKTSDMACVGIDWDGAQNFTAPLSSCHAPYAVASGNGPGSNSSFNISGSPTTQFLCGNYATTQGRINGTAVKCPK